MTDNDQTVLKASGRPPKGDVALTPAQRQKAYKLRRNRAMHDAIALAIERGDSSETHVPALLDALAWALEKAGGERGDGAVDRRAVGKNAAREIISELSRRYNLNRHSDETPKG